MPGTASITQRYYPQLSDLIDVDDLPDFLSFAKDGLVTLLDSITYNILGLKYAALNLDQLGGFLVIN